MPANVAESYSSVNTSLPPQPLPEKPDTLTCHRCAEHSIPAPEGATAETRYVCPECSPLAEEDIHFDRCQFDNASFGEARLSAGSMDILHSLQNGWKSIIRRCKPRAITSRDRGEDWIAKATHENLLRLTERRRLSLILTAWCGLTSPQAASIMGMKDYQVRMAVSEAKQKLIGMTDSRPYRCATEDNQECEDRDRKSA